MLPKDKKLPDHLALGARGEEAAVAFLKSRGMKILERNWRPGLEAGEGQGGAALELDIIAQDGTTLVFAEVKSRKLQPGSGFSPLDNFSAAKRGRLRKAARLYLERYQAWERPCRFDLLCVTFGAGSLGWSPEKPDKGDNPGKADKLGKTDRPEIEHFQDVIQTGEVF